MTRAPCRYFNGRLSPGPGLPETSSISDPTTTAYYERLTRQPQQSFVRFSSFGKRTITKSIAFSLVDVSSSSPSVLSSLHPAIPMDFTDCSPPALPPDDCHGRFTHNRACRPPVADVATLPRLFDFKYPRTRLQVFTHRSYYARPTAVFEDPADDIAPDNEVLEFVGDSVLSLAVATLVRETHPGLRVGPHAKIKALVVQNATIAHISEHYQLAQNLRANSSQLVALRHSPVVQADLFEAYLGGLYVDWGYEHIRPWLFRVLKPYIEEAYRIVRNDYDVSPNKRGGGGLSGPLKGRAVAQSGNNSPQSHLTGKPKSGSPYTLGSLLAATSHKQMMSAEALHVNMMMMTPTSLPASSTNLGGSAELPESPAPPSYSPAFQPNTPPRSSTMAEGHLPLLNQVLQHAKRWIDWDYQLDPTSPPTTPIWDASGKMSSVLVCQGRGNTKKLAKNDAARRLVEELQARLGRSGGTTPDLAKELERWYMEKQTSTIYEEQEDFSPQMNFKFSSLDLGQSSSSRSTSHQPPYQWGTPYGNP